MSNRNSGPDENDVAAAILSAEVDDGITLTNLLIAADFTLSDRLNFGLRLARTIASLPNKD